MTINSPQPRQIPELKALWMQAFGDPESFVDGFLRTGFSPDRCRCVTVDERVAAALYWFDCFSGGQKWAYIYAVATDLSHRGKGLCRALMEDTHRHLKEKGYAGAVLVPAEDGLWHYYQKQGYLPFGSIHAFTACAGDLPVSLARIDPQTYAQTRRQYLPAGGLDQQSAFPFYETWGGFYRGDGFCFAAARNEDTLFVQEFLGAQGKILGILRSLSVTTGRFRAVGGGIPCGMYLPFTPEAAAPSYLGFPLD